jgi:hypothetical protein
LSPVVGALVAACGGSVAHQGAPTDDAGTSSPAFGSLDVGVAEGAPGEGASIANDRPRAPGEFEQEGRKIGRVEGRRPGLPTFRPSDLPVDLCAARYVTLLTSRSR